MKSKTLAKILKFFPVEIGYREVCFPKKYLKKLIEEGKIKWEYMQRLGLNVERFQKHT